jgi:hypothetical protein
LTADDLFAQVAFAAIFLTPFLACALALSLIVEPVRLRNNPRRSVGSFAN